MNLLLQRVETKETDIQEYLFSRTVLYNLQPMGLGTPYIESITSYISRLAIKHNVHVTTLLNEVIGPYIQRSYLTEKFSKGLVPNRYNLVNGISTINIEFIKVLEILTGRNDIQHLSFKNWEGILSSNIVDKNRKWCHACLEQWRKESREIYEPLIWSVSSVKKCDIHEIRLQEQCPKCNKELPLAHRHLIVGYCQYCSEWLGKRESENEKVSFSDYEHFIMKSYKQLLELGPNLSSFPSENSICLLLPMIKKGLGINQVLDFAQYLEVNYTGLISWMKNRHNPNPDALMSICYKVDTTIFDLILMAINNVEYDFKKPSVKKKVASKELVKKQLLIEVNSEKPRSLAEVCQEVGVTSKFAKGNFPELSQKIKENFSRYQKRIKLLEQKRISQVLEEALNENIPESLKKTLELNNISYKSAKRYHPELSEQLSAKYLEFTSESKNIRIKKTKAEIKAAIYHLNHEGTYPSVQKIAKMLTNNNPNIFRQKVYNDFRKSVLLNLGYKV